MVWNKVETRFSIVMMSVLTSLVGLISSGMTSLAIEGRQQSVQSQNGFMSNAPNNTLLGNQSKRPSTHIIHKEVVVAGVPGRLPLRNGMAYREARQRLLRQGWQPNLQGDPPNLRDRSVRELFDLGYREIKDCAGTGEGPCLFEFVDAKGTLLSVVATTGGSANINRFVRNWWVEKKTGTTQPDSTNKIVDGFYSLGGTDQGLEVRGQRYRYYDELGNKPWRSISELQYITSGVVFDGKNYWCLSTLTPQIRHSACSANGWT
ncbi:MAG: hypothetical protein KME16_11805 [Scytolyngbya sp. HA4215-MV1]|jgi:hypothetical protein|nr:hypothetical protein [Scytolyngbya sp. HA4215-MV1]